MNPLVPSKTAHPMAPLVERVVVPAAFIGIGICIGLYIARRRRLAAVAAG